VIDYDAKSESTENDKSLWTEKEHSDFVLQVDWRIKETPWVNSYARIVMPDGREKKGADGEDILIAVPDSDSGIYLRGVSTTAERMNREIGIALLRLSNSETFASSSSTARQRARKSPAENSAPPRSCPFGVSFIQGFFHSRLLKNRGSRDKIGVAGRFIWIVQVALGHDNET